MVFSTASGHLARSNPLIPELALLAMVRQESILQDDGTYAFETKYTLLTVQCNTTSIIIFRWVYIGTLALSQRQFQR